MNRAAWFLSIVTAVVLLFQTGTTVAYTPLTALGGVFISVGVWLLGRPQRNVG